MDTHRRILLRGKYNTRMRGAILALTAVFTEACQNLYTWRASFCDWLLLALLCFAAATCPVFLPLLGQTMPAAAGLRCSGELRNAASVVVARGLHCAKPGTRKCLHPAAQARAPLTAARRRASPAARRRGAVPHDDWTQHAKACKNHSRGGRGNMGSPRGNIGPTCWPAYPHFSLRHRYKDANLR